jgi:hypothetical protein
MGQARGSAAELVIDFETTYGADPAGVSGILVPFNYPWNVKTTRDLSRGNTNRGIRDGEMPFYGNLDLKGSPSVPVDQVAIGYWLRALLGAPTTGGAGPYTHVFKPAAAIPSLVNDLGFTDIGKYLKHNGIKVNKFAVEGGAAAGELVAKLELIGAKETSGTSPYDATPTSLTFSRFHNKQASLQEGGGAIAIVRDWSFEIDNQLDGDTYVIDGSGGVRGALHEGECLAKGKIKAFFQDLTLYNKAVNGTESSLKVTLTSGTYSLEFFFPELLYKPSTPEIVKGGIWVELEWEAYYENSATAAILSATLINGQAAYA